VVKVDPEHAATLVAAGVGMARLLAEPLKAQLPIAV
jgi:hypothetical protein